jgi:alpha-mannosidase
MFWTEEKLKQRIAEIGELRYRTITRFEVLEMLTDELGEIAAEPPGKDTWDTLQLGERWSGRDRYVWLKVEALLPEQLAEHRLVGRFDFGRTHHGNSQGFESLLFLNGHPLQGVDSNHQEVFLDELAGQPVQLIFRLWSGLEGGGVPQLQIHEIKRAELSFLHTASDDLYYTARAVRETVSVLPDTTPDRQTLLALLNRSLNRVDWSKPGSDAYYGSVAEAAAALREGLELLPANHPVTIRCIGHTHIDVAWLWRLRHTREKAARSFSTVLRLMEEYPEYIFLQTQPQLYEYIKTDYPELYAQICERIWEGRWEAGGAMWLEADCNLTSGESLVRQLLFGTRFFREEFGAECKYLWLPDVFGYSWALPQILRKSGITSFMTTKISWSQYNRMPHDTFVWRGMDGSEVLTHFITTPEIEFPHETYYTYNGYVVPETLTGIWRNYRDKAWNEELLLCYGFGDGGGGVNRDMLEMRRRLDRMPGLPKAVTGRADTFFQELEEKAATTDQYVHVWDGELYLENHQGTYTSQAFIKKANRRFELSLRETELWSVWAGLVNPAVSISQAQEQLNRVWKIVLRNQFHDIIPGSSIAEVYEDAREEYAEAAQLLEQVKRKTESALLSIGGRASVATDSRRDTAKGYTVLNSGSWNRSGLVTIAGEDGQTAGCWRRSDHSLLQAQRTTEGWLVEVADAPSCGLLPIWYEPEGRAVEVGRLPFTYTGISLETPFYVLEWNEAGQFTRIYDRQNGREVLAPGACGNLLQVFEDKPMQFDAWNIDLFYQEKCRTVTELRSVRLQEAGPLRAVVSFEWGYMDSVIRQELVVYAGSRRMDFRTAVDWREQHQLLKAAFPVDIRAMEATYDVQFGNVKRPTHWNTSWDYARFENVGHQWVDLSERGYGVSLLNDCKYGYDVKENVLRISLIKSATYPDPHADQGEHQFTYSLLPHEGDWLMGGTVREAWDLNCPMIGTAGLPEGEAGSFITFSADHVWVDAVKSAEDGTGIILRLHEFAGRRGQLTVRTAGELVSWKETNLMEQPDGEEQAGPFKFHIKPYEIKTFLLRLRGEEE